MSARDEVRAQAWREAMPFPLVRIVVNKTAIDAWLQNGNADDRANYEAMLAAGMIEVRDLQSLPCSSTGCSLPAVELLTFNGIPGHMHYCETHVSEYRQFDPVASARIFNGRCPWPCRMEPVRL